MTRLVPESVDADPIVQFGRWYDEAVAAGVRQPEAMTLATARPGGEVSARTVLMRGHDERGFAFYTNLESAKAADLETNPRAALVFHWRELERQVRVVGPVSRLDRDETERYWAARPRGHRVGAWASPQSHPIDADALDARLAEVEGSVRRAGAAVAGVLGWLRGRRRRARVVAGPHRSPARPRRLSPRARPDLHTRAASALISTPTLARCGPIRRFPAARPTRGLEPPLAVRGECPS